MALDLTPQRHFFCKASFHLTSPEPGLLDRAALSERAESRERLLADRLAQNRVGRIKALRLYVCFSIEGDPPSGYQTLDFPAY